MAAKIHCIDIVHMDFASVAQYNNDELYRYMLFTCRSTKQRLIPKRIRWNAFRVSREPNTVRIHLLYAKDKVTEPKEVARFGFIPGPDFSRIL